MKLCNRPSIGMRNLKTALAVFICVVVFALMGPNFNPLFAAVAAVITMESNIEETVESGWNRILGTIIGGATGIFGIFIANLIPFRFGYVAVIPLGVIGLIYLCNNFKKHGAITITCIMFISVMTTYSQDLGNYMLAAMRLLETAFGIIVAYLVNRFIKLPECDAKKNHENPNKAKEEKWLSADEKKSNDRKKMNVASVIYMILKP